MARWISTTEAANRLDVCPMTIRNWATNRMSGKPSRIRYARIHHGKIQVSRREIITLKKKSRAPR